MMRALRLLLTIVAVSFCGAAAAQSDLGSTTPPSTKSAGGCVAQPTPKCLLADAQAAAMLLTDNRIALSNLAFIGWAQALSGDREAALDTLRVGDLRAIGAGPDFLSNYQAAAAGVWAVLGDEAKTKAAVEAALQHLNDLDASGRAMALADAAYAQALLGDRTAAAASVQQALGEARGANNDPFLLIYVGWNEALLGDGAGALPIIQEALDALDARPEKDQALSVWTIGYAAMGLAIAADPTAGATRDRLKKALADGAIDDTTIEASMMLAWSYGVSGERERAQAIVAEHLAEAYRVTDLNTKAIALTCAAFALAPPIHANP